MTTKNPYRYTWFWALLAVALAVPAAHAVEVNNITLGRFEDFAVVTLYGDAPLTVTHQMVEAKEGKPNRIVVDVAGARHALPDHNFRDLPKSSIAAIRTSQFAVSPEPVVRIVLDLSQAAAYQLKTSGRRVRIMVSLPQDPPITLEWSARDLTTGNVYATTEHEAKQAEPRAPAQRPATPQVKAQPAAQPEFPSKPVAVARPKAQPKTQITPQKPAAAKPMAVKPEAKAAPKPAVTPKPAVAAKPKAKVTVKPATIPSPASDAKPAYVQDNLDSDQKRFEEVIPVTMPKSRPTQEIYYDIPAPSPVNLTQVPKPEAKAKTPAPKPDAAKVAKAKPKAESKLAMTASSPSAQSSDQSAATMPVPDEGSKPVASLTTLPPPMPEPAEIVPQREKIVYRTMGRRDPFAPLIRVGAAYNAAALPDINGLRMVGVLHDIKNSWGLFEDANGYGYILKQGDRVRNGRLAKLTKNKAFFQLTEFGWSRSVQLDLEREG